VERRRLYGLERRVGKDASWIEGDLVCSVPKGGRLKRFEIAEDGGVEGGMCGFKLAAEEGEHSAHVDVWVKESDAAYGITDEQTEPVEGAAHVGKRDLGGVCDGLEVDADALEAKDSIAACSSEVKRHGAPTDRRRHESSR
jgi:hypothetical protein